MRKIFLAMLLVLTALTATAKNRIIKNPTVEYTPTFICVNEIEFAKDATILRCELRNRPHWWVKVESTTYLKDRDSERMWKLLKVEGVEQDKEIWMPEEGHVPCTLYFEPIPGDVKEVNLLENENNPESGVYGISLASPVKTKSKAKTIDPRTMTADYYMNQPFTPDTTWHFSNKPYREMEYYRPGRAHVEIQMDNLPRELREQVNSKFVSGQDQILRKQITLTSQLNDDNRYVFDIDLPGPMTLYLELLGNYFVQPGDTLEIFTTMERDPFGEKRYEAYRSNSETAMINALLPTMLERLGIPKERAVYDSSKKALAEGKESCERLAEEWNTILERILTSDEARQTLINSPLSAFGKDLVMTYALAKMGEHIEDLYQEYEDENDRYIPVQGADGRARKKENPDYVPLDKEKVYAQMLRHRDLFYNNPLVLCTNWPFINRTLYGGLFNNTEQVESGVENVFYSRVVDSFGMKGTFMYDLGQSQDFASRLGYLLKEVQLGNMKPNEVFDSYALAECVAKISNPPVVRAFLNECCAVAVRLEGGKKAVAYEDKWTAEQKALWKKIVEPYAGNLLFVDFWGMGCGPCRSGMLNMRDKVEALKDDKFRFLYVCDEKDSPRDKAEKWMTENNIKGEHIYVTHDEWNQLEAMFNFTGIPHAVFADKKGKVVQNDFQLYQHSADQLREMIERF